MCDILVIDDRTDSKGSATEEAESMSKETEARAFCRGWQYGYEKGEASARDVLASCPTIDAKHLDLFLNGNDDGVAGDTRRYDAQIAILKVC